MKKVFTFLVALIISVSLKAQTITEQDLKYWYPYIEAIATIESKKDPNAVSKSGKYVGYLQEAKIIVDDVNQYLKKKVYKYSDRYDKEKSIEMFIYIQKRYNPKYDVSKGIRLWCSGCGGYNSKSAYRYYNKVMNKFSLTAYNEPGF